jgi:dolichol-phosphate mannosyltransferase
MIGECQDGPEVSVVVPLFNERDNVLPVHAALKEQLDALDVSYELILVNDGSGDETPTLIGELAAADDSVVAVHLSRNFGHQAAVTAGLDHARGRAVVVMDGDGQDPPNVLGQFVSLWRQGFDVVYAIRRNRKEGFLRRFAYQAFYRLLDRISDVPMPRDSGDFCLMDRRVVDALTALPERQRFVRGLRAFVGFRQIGLAYDRPARAFGESKYTLRQLARLALDGLVGFSTFPLRCVTYLGFGAAVAAFGLIAWVMWQALVSHAGPPGWASTIAVVLFASAAQLLSLGVIGEYVHRIFVEVKGRPAYLVDRIEGRRPAQESFPTKTTAA